MQNITKYFYQSDAWEKIVNHPEYELGRRELQVLVSFLREFGSLMPTRNIIHLGIGDGREVPHILKRLTSVKNYTLVDICPFALMSAYTKATATFSDINFEKKLKDIETPNFFSSLKKVLGSTLIILVGNGVILSNQLITLEIHQGMKSDDLLLLTTEEPHLKMAGSYDIKPVYALISRGGIKASRKNTKIIYDNNDQCLKMICNGKILLASYKPTFKQLRERMQKSGFEEVCLKEYSNNYMIGSLWKKF